MSKTAADQVSVAQNGESYDGAPMYEVRLAGRMIDRTSHRNWCDQMAERLREALTAAEGDNE